MNRNQILNLSLFVVLIGFSSTFISYTSSFQRQTVSAQSCASEDECKEDSDCGNRNDGCTACYLGICAPPPPVSTQTRTPTPTPTSPRACGVLCQSDNFCSNVNDGCTRCATGSVRICMAPNTCYCDLSVVLSSACNIGNTATCTSQFSCTCLAPTRTPTLVSNTNLLLNSGFEIDADGNNKPDNWTTDSRFTRSSERKQSGAYSGRHYATDNSSFTINQKVNNITPGKTYRFKAAVNIPSTSDSFDFRIQVSWYNSSGSLLGTTVIKKYSTHTSGSWNYSDSTFTSPANTSYAWVKMKVESLNAKIYVDTFTFARN